MKEGLHPASSTLLASNERSRDNGRGERKERRGRSRMGRKERRENHALSGTGGITPLLNELAPKTPMGSRMGEWAFQDGKVEQHLLPVAILQTRRSCHWLDRKKLVSDGRPRLQPKLGLETAAEAGRPRPLFRDLVAVCLAVHWSVRGQLETRHGFRSLLAFSARLGATSVQVSVSFFFHGRFHPLRRASVHRCTI
jgi:hypothetical protein